MHLSALQIILQRPWLQRKWIKLATIKQHAMFMLVFRQRLISIKILYSKQIQQYCIFALILSSQNTNYSTFVFLSDENDLNEKFQDTEQGSRLPKLTAINAVWNKQSINVRVQLVRQQIWLRTLQQQISERLQGISHMGVQVTGLFSQLGFAFLETEAFLSHVKHETLHPTDICGWQTSQSWSLQLWHHKTTAIQAWNILKHQSCNQSMNSEHIIFCAKAAHTTDASLEVLH